MELSQLRLDGFLPFGPFSRSFSLLKGGLIEVALKQIGKFLSAHSFII